MWLYNEFIFNRRTNFYYRDFNYTMLMDAFKGLRQSNSVEGQIVPLEV